MLFFAHNVNKTICYQFHIAPASPKAAYTFDTIRTPTSAISFNVILPQQ